MRHLMATKRMLAVAIVALGCVLAAPLSLPGGAAGASSGAAPASAADSVVAAGRGRYYYTDIGIILLSGAPGQGPTGSASFNVFGIPILGPVTCLSVTGPDLGGGRPGSPTTAVMNVLSTTFGVVTVRLVDNGGNGADTISAYPAGRGEGDCSPFTGGVDDVLIAGRATVFDAPLIPTSKDQCKNGGYAQFGFRNQGQCVAFVNHH